MIAFVIADLQVPQGIDHLFCSGWLVIARRPWDHVLLGAVVFLVVFTKERDAAGNRDSENKVL